MEQGKSSCFESSFRFAYQGPSQSSTASNEKIHASFSWCIHLCHILPATDDFQGFFNCHTQRVKENYTSHQSAMSFTTKYTLVVCVTATQDTVWRYFLYTQIWGYYEDYSYKERETVQQINTYHKVNTVFWKPFIDTKN